MYENAMSPADVAAVMRNNDGYGGGMRGGFNLDTIIILFLFFMMGWGGNGWGGNGGGNAANIERFVQNGFDQSAVIAAINSANTAIGQLGLQICNGVNAVTSAVNTVGANVLAAMNNGFAQAEIAENGRQISNMNQMFGIQSTIQQQGFNTQLATVDLKNTVATEACADRAAIESALRDVTAQGVANTQLLMNTFNAGIQSLRDQGYADKMDSKNEKIAELQQQLYMKDLYASQIAQDGRIIDGLYNRLSTCPIDTTPVFGHQQIFQRAQNQGCPCGYGYSA